MWSTLGHFTQEELNLLPTKIKNGKSAGLTEITPEVWKTRKFNDRQLWYCNTVYIQNTIERWTKGWKKDDLGIAKNYWGITLTSIATKIYTVLLLNCIEPHIEKILRKNQNGFRINWSTTSQTLTLLNFRSLCKKPWGDTLICRLLQGNTQRQDGANTSSLWSPQKNCHSHNDLL